MHVKVRVTAGARRERVVRESETSFAISVRAVAARNEANERVRELLADAFVCDVRRVHLLRGHRSSVKLYVVALTES